MTLPPSPCPARIARVLGGKQCRAFVAIPRFLFCPVYCTVRSVYDERACPDGQGCPFPATGKGGDGRYQLSVFGAIGPRTPTPLCFDDTNNSTMCVAVVLCASVQWNTERQGSRLKTVVVKAVFPVQERMRMRREEPEHYWAIVSTLRTERGCPLAVGKGCRANSPIFSVDRSFGSIRVVLVPACTSLYPFF